MSIRKKMIFFKIVKILKNVLALIIIHEHLWISRESSTNRQIGFLDIVYLVVVGWEEEMGGKIRERMPLIITVDIIKQ